MKQFTITLALFGLVLMAAPAAHAYVGPGLGLGMLGTLFGILAAIVLAIVGLFWYPIKRMMNRKQAAPGAPAPDTNREPRGE